MEHDAFCDPGLCSVNLKQPRRVGARPAAVEKQSRDVGRESGQDALGGVPREATGSNGPRYRKRVAFRRVHYRALSASAQDAAVLGRQAVIRRHEERGPKQVEQAREQNADGCER